MELTGYTIRLIDLSYFLHIGFYPEERKLGQRIFIDLELNINSDQKSFEQINTVFDYSSIHQAVETLLSKKQYQFLEDLASDLAADLLKDKRLLSVRICIKKPSAPVQAILKQIEVDMTFKK